MNRYFFILLFILICEQPVLSQTITDTEAVKIALQEKRVGSSDKDIATKLLQRGATMEQIQRIRQQYERQNSLGTLSKVVDNSVGKTKDRMRINNEVIERDTVDNEDLMLPASMFEEQEPAVKRVFGRDIFNIKSLTFEPQMNIATPQNYVLGPGDQLNIDVYGASQESMSLTVSPDGDITIPEFGPVQVAGLTVSTAQSRIRSKLGNYFQSSDIKASLGQTRTILVNVMGEVRTPGTYTLSAFSTVFHALYRAGGISDLGTLRNIKVFRQGRQISVVDVYEFILNGRLAGNVRLQDDDVIQVGTYDCIVDIAGKVKRPMAYEMRETESLATLLKYSGGFTGDAFKKLLRVFRKSEDRKSVYNVEEFELAEFKVADGDSVIVDSIIDRFKDMVEVKGAIFRPGMYRLGEKVTGIRSLVSLASGLTEEALATHAVLRRMKPNRTQEVISVDLAGIMNGSVADVPLRNEDILYIPTLAEHQNIRTLTIDGEILFPGTYEYADNMTIEDLILEAGGLTDAASMVKVDVSRQFNDPFAESAGLELARTFSFSIKDNYKIDGDSCFKLRPYDIVQIRKSPVYQAPVRVSVEGEVSFCGIYTMEKKNQRLSDVVKAAGGVIPGGNIRGASLIRKMNDDEKTRMRAVVNIARLSADGKDSISLDKIAQSESYTVGIHLDEALAHPGSTQDIELVDGDRLVVPRYNNTVRISGDVNAPNTVAYDEGKNYKYYIRQAGGYGDRAKKRHAYIVYQNGTMALAKEGRVESGCEIVVPTKAPRDASSISQWLSLGTSAASLATMFATIANLLK